MRTLSDVRERGLRIGPAPAVAAFVLILFAGVYTGRLATAAALALLPLLATLFLSDATAYKAHGRPSRLIPLVIAASPLLRWLTPGVGRAYFTFATLWAALAWFLVLAYSEISEADDRRAFGRRAGGLAVPLICLVVTTALAQIAAGDLERPSAQLLQAWSLYFLVGMVGFYLLACLYCSSVERIEALMWWALIFGVPQVLVILEQRVLNGGVGPIQHVLQVQPVAGTYVFGVLGDGELTAELLVTLFIWSLSLALWSPVGRRRTGATILTVAYLVGAVSLSHRSAVMGAVGAALLIAIVSQGPATRRSDVGRAVAIVAVAVLMFAASGTARSLPSSAVSRMGSQNTLFLSANDVGLANRGHIYAAAGRLIPGLPLTGYGMDHVRPLVYEAHTPISSTHSIWLWGLLSAGFMGLGATILVFVVLLVYALRTWARTRSGISIALLVTLLFVIVDQSKVDAVRQPVYAFFLFAVFGMIASHWRLVQRPPADTAS
jgi:O-antigen ligase